MTDSAPGIRDALGKCETQFIGGQSPTTTGNWIQLDMTVISTYFPHATGLDCASPGTPSRQVLLGQWEPTAPWLNPHESKPTKVYPTEMKSPLEMS